MIIMIIIIITIILLLIIIILIGGDVPAAGEGPRQRVAGDRAAVLWVDY